MKIINKHINNNAYPPIQEGTFLYCPEECYIVPDDLDLTEFYNNGGFVTLTVEDNVVKEITPNTTAWQTWKDEHPQKTPETTNTSEATTEELINTILGV